MFYILVVGYAYWSSEKRKEELSEHIEHLTFSVDKAAKGTLINSPFPLIILETNGNTIWKNEKFSKVVRIRTAPTAGMPRASALRRCCRTRRAAA